jgi:putative endopeptidase
LGNQLRTGRHRWEALAAQSGQRIDAAAWQMSPLAVNAFYDPQLNEINLPAGILQAPLFDPAADDAENYGGIGAQIGHEASHGFDNLGSQFDAQGVMRDWMDAADRAAMAPRTAALLAQYGAYQVLPGKPLDAELTLPENLADTIGLQIAFRAYQASLGGRPSPVRHGLSGEQRFFIAFAQSWRIKQRDERRLQLLADPHAPHEFRANGPVQHVDGFHQAFGTQPGDRLYRAPAERLRLW